jgi:hypothetical protein
MGDNRAPLASRDSRVFGRCRSRQVAGRAAWVVWPWLRDDRRRLALEPARPLRPRPVDRPVPTPAGVRSRRGARRARARPRALHRGEHERDVLPQLHAQLLGAAPHVVADDAARERLVLELLLQAGQLHARTSLSGRTRAAAVIRPVTSSQA